MNEIRGVRKKNVIKLWRKTHTLAFGMKPVFRSYHYVF